MEGTPLTVLLIEDDAGYARFVDEIINDVKVFSLKLLRAENLKEGLDCLSKNEIDIILLDLILPDSNGLDTFLHIRNVTPNIPIVILSSIQDEGLAYKAVSEGAQDFIFKTEMVPSILARTLRYSVERKHIEDKLHESEEQLMAQYKNIPIPTFTWQSKGNDFVLTNFNDAALEIADGKLTKLLGKSSTDLLKDDPEIIEDFKRCFENKATIKREFVYEIKSIDKTRHFAVSYAYSPPDFVLVHAEDITDRKIAEKVLKRSQIDLELLVKKRTLQIERVNNELRQEIEERKNAEDALRSLWKAVESMQVGITIADLDGNIVYTNPSDAKMHGWDVNDLLGKKARLFAPSVTWAPLTMEKIKELDTHTRETKNVRKDGSIFPARLTSDVVRTDNGEPIFIVSTCVDITKSKKMEEALRRLSITDSLTNLYNHGHFHKSLKSEMKRAKRMAYPLCVILFDLNYFKEYNDNFGHLAGDNVLKKVGETFKESIRNGVDSAYRIGGDEFAIILPHTIEIDAKDLANRICNKVVANIKDIGISAGVAAIDGKVTANEFINSADKDMYFHKKSQKKQ
jgi:diguanylate cyclase (GGDEF)-like protein/PAS domain S-box-containing protein